MISKCILLVACAYISTCQAAFVDTLNKCSIKDVECIKNLIHKISVDASKNGIEELNIPPTDPLKIKNMKVSVLNVLNFTLDDVTVNGLKDCAINKIDIQLDKGEATFGLLCNGVVEGKHKIEGSSPIFQNVFGGESVHSDGTFKLDLSKLQLTLNLAFDVVKKEDGEIYFNGKREEFRYTIDIGDFKLDGNNIFLGETDSTKVMLDFVNQNWKTVMQSFGKSFYDVAIDIVYDILLNFFNNVPAKHFITEDLSSYVK